ncbi:hypothetical protein AB4Y44_09915 [Paraburkholderia sp. BR10937]|uniref:hypothetical protein n=1 Tax=Paraburkholderia sp. BR10937 TaxID=3236994 RepID=UPI0034D29F9B
MVVKNQHGWTRDRVDLQVHAFVHRKNHDTTLSIDLRQAGIRTGGLFQEMLDGAECPASIHHANALRLIVRESSSPRLRQIFSTPAAALFPSQIAELISLVDDTLEKLTGLRIKGPYVTAVRHFLKQCDRPLANGDPVKIVEMKSRFNAHGGKPIDRRIAPSFDPFNPRENTPPLSAIEFNSFKERDAVALEHQTAAVQSIITSCEALFNVHDAFIEKLRIARSTDLPNSLHRNVISNIEDGGITTHAVFKTLDPDTRFLLIARMVVNARLHRSPSKSFVPSDSVPALVDALPYERRGGAYDIMLSEFYLPRHIVTACIAVLMATTGWNLSTVLSLTRDNVRKNEDGSYALEGLKSKTDQIQLTETNENLSSVEPSSTQIPSKEIDDRTAIRSLDYIVKHRNNIETHCPKSLKNDSLFVSLKMRNRSSRYEFDIQNPTKEFHQICTALGIPSIALAQIRNLVANRHYLSSGGNIFSTQDFLAHSSADVTSQYLNTTLVRLLGEANMLRFMRLLEACILYSTGRQNRLTKKQLTDVQRNNLLLFPTSTLQDDKIECIADRWINSFGSYPIVIGENELKHTIIQRRFYRRSTSQLISANHERFVRFHLPRILFCESLYRVLSAGQFAQKLHSLEAEFPDEANVIH